MKAIVSYGDDMLSPCINGSTVKFLLYFTKCNFEALLQFKVPISGPPYGQRSYQVTQKLASEMLTL